MVSSARWAAEEGRGGFKDDGRKAPPRRGGRALSRLLPARTQGPRGPPGPAVEGWSGDCPYLPGQARCRQPSQPQHVALCTREVDRVWRRSCQRFLCDGLPAGLPNTARGQAGPQVPARCPWRGWGRGTAGGGAQAGRGGWWARRGPSDSAHTPSPRRRAGTCSAACTAPGATNPVTTVSLCFLTQNYRHAYDLIQKLYPSAHHSTVHQGLVGAGPSGHFQAPLQAQASGPVRPSEGRPRNRGHFANWRSGRVRAQVRVPQERGRCPQPSAGRCMDGAVAQQEALEPQGPWGGPPSPAEDAPAEASSRGAWTRGPAPAPHQGLSQRKVHRQVLFGTDCEATSLLRGM